MYDNGIGVDSILLFLCLVGGKMLIIGWIGVDIGVVIGYIICI